MKVGSTLAAVQSPTLAQTRPAPPVAFAPLQVVPPVVVVVGGAAVLWWLWRRQLPRRR